MYTVLAYIDLFNGFNPPSPPFSKEGVVFVKNGFRLDDSPSFFKEGLGEIIDRLKRSPYTPNDRVAFIPPPI